MLRPVVLLAVAAALAYPGAAAAANFTGIVTQEATITLNDEAGQRVTRMAVGAHTITVRDLSNEHNFHLTGPGVNRATGVEFVGTEVWQVTVTDGNYTYVCDPHSTTMRGSFTVGTPPPPPPPPPPPAGPSTGRRLMATVGPGFTISLANASGRRVRTVRAGTYTITVRDRSRFHNFHLVGSGMNRRTSVAFMGTQTWRVTLRKGRTYRFVCDPHARAMKGSLRVT